MHITPIPTEYRGYRMRSMLEARWAAFFDALRIKWEYEPAGYLVGDRGYTPDFWLPDFDTAYGGSREGTFVEVKPIGGDFDRAKEFSRATGYQILAAEGPPDTVVYRLHYVLRPPNRACTATVRFYSKYLPDGVYGDEYRLLWWPPENVDFGRDAIVVRAVYAARALQYSHKSKRVV